MHACVHIHTHTHTRSQKQSRKLTRRDCNNRKVQKLCRQGGVGGTEPSHPLLAMLKETDGLFNTHKSLKKNYKQHPLRRNKALASLFISWQYSAASPSPYGPEDTSIGL